MSGEIEEFSDEFCNLPCGIIPDGKSVGRKFLNYKYPRDKKMKNKTLREAQQKNKKVPS